MNESAASSVADEIQGVGGCALGVTVDVARKSDVAKAVRQVNEDLGDIDMLVNCAGIDPRSLVVEMAEEE